MYVWDVMMVLFRLKISERDVLWVERYHGEKEDGKVQHAS